MKKVLGWRVRRCRGAAEYLGFAAGPSTPFPWVKREFSRLYETREGAKDHATWMRSGYAGTEIVRIVAKPKATKPECGHVPRGQASLRTCRMPVGHHGPHFDYEPLDKPWQCWLDDGTPLVVRTADKLEQAIAKIESVIARTRQDLEDAKRDEEWSNVAAFHNQALAEDNVLRILRGFR